MRKQLTTTRLPNNQEVFCLRESEASILYQQVQGYLKYGINIEAGDTLFDVGANIGLFTLMANDRCAGRANIFAFEPVPDIFAVLKHNANRFNLEKIKTFQICLGRRSQTIDFAYYPNATAISSLYPDSSGEEKKQFGKTIKENLAQLPFPINLVQLLPEPLLSFAIDRMVYFAYFEEKVECQMKTISQVIAEQSVTQIDLLKIDVEKAELDVIEGIEAQDWSKIQQIVVEVHNINNRVQRIVDLLQDKGFDVNREQDPIFKHLDIYTVYAKKAI